MPKVTSDQILEDLIGHATVTTLFSRGGIVLMAIYTPQDRPTFKVWRGDAAVEFESLVEASVYVEQHQED